MAARSLLAQQEASNSASGWRSVRLGDLEEDGTLSIKNGYAQGVHNVDGTGVPHLRPFNISNNGTIDLAQIKYVSAPSRKASYWLRLNDVLFNNTNSEELVGKTAIFEMDGDFVLSNHMTIVRILNSNVIEPYWLALYFHDLWRMRVFHGLCRRHVNQASVGLERLRGLEIALPSLAEQRAIACVLRAIQQAKEATENVITATRELESSLMRHLFTYGAVPLAEADAIKLQETKIGLIPRNWMSVPLGSVATISAGSTPSTAEPSYWSGTIPFIKTSEIVNNEITSAKSHVTVEATRAYRLKLYEPGTVFLAMYGQGKTRGQVALLRITATTSQNTGAIVVGASLDAEFLWMYLLSRYEDLRASGIQGHISHLNAGYLKQVVVPVPPFSDQRAIAGILVAARSKLSAEEARAQALTSLFESIISELMTGRRRVAITEAADG